MAKRVDELLRTYDAQSEQIQALGDAQRKQLSALQTRSDESRAAQSEASRQAGRALELLEGCLAALRDQRAQIDRLGRQLGAQTEAIGEVKAHIESQGQTLASHTTQLEYLAQPWYRRMWRRIT